MERLSLLVFDGSQPIGEYPVKVKTDIPSAVQEILTKLRPHLSGVILDSHGILAHSVNLPHDNVWYRPNALHI